MRIGITTICTAIQPNPVIRRNSVEVVKQGILKIHILQNVIVYIGIRCLSQLPRRCNGEIEPVVSIGIRGIILHVRPLHAVTIRFHHQFLTSIIESRSRPHIQFRLIYNGIKAPSASEDRELRIGNVRDRGIPAQSAHRRLIKHVDGITLIVSQPCKWRMVDSHRCLTCNITGILTTAEDIVCNDEIALACSQIYVIEPRIHILCYEAHELLSVQASQLSDVIHHDL